MTLFTHPDRAHKTAQTSYSRQHTTPPSLHPAGALHPPHPSPSDAPPLDALSISSPTAQGPTGGVSDNCQSHRPEQAACSTVRCGPRSGTVWAITMGRAEWGPRGRQGRWLLFDSDIVWRGKRGSEGVDEGVYERVWWVIRTVRA